MATKATLFLVFVVSMIRKCIYFFAPQVSAVCTVGRLRNKKYNPNIHYTHYVAKMRPE